MRAVTVQQPWAWAIIHGEKNVENRTQYGMWRRAGGQRIAVHAGARWSIDGWRSPFIAQAWTRVTGEFMRSIPLDADPRLPLGALIGTVQVVDVHPAVGACCAPWGEENDGVVHLVLEDPEPFAVPVPVRGKLGLWHLPADLEVPKALGRAS